MTDIVEYLLRLCVGGICCAAALTMAGVGAKREITKFACTCIMLLLCFSGMKEIEFELPEIMHHEELKNVVDDALKKHSELQKSEIDTKLSQHIQEQAVAIGCICRARVQSYLDEGEYVIQKVTIVTDDAAAHQELQDWLVTTLKIRTAQIRWEEAA